MKRKFLNPKFLLFQFLMSKNLNQKIRPVLIKTNKEKQRRITLKYSGNSLEKRFVEVFARSDITFTAFSILFLRIFLVEKSSETEEREKRGTRVNETDKEEWESKGGKMECCKIFVRKG